MFATSAHQTTLYHYQKNIDQLDESERDKVVEISRKHNEKLQEKEFEFIDPFDNASDKAGNKSYYDALNIGETMGRLKINKIKADLPIYHGTNANVLSKGVGHLENTSLPLGNEGEYSVITAHRGLPSSKLFRHIDELKIDDEFSIQILDDFMTYKIYEIDTVLPNETEWLVAEANRNIVTLLSCEPYMINTHRMLLKGELISKEKVTENERLTESGYKLRYLTYVFIFLLLILVLLLAFFLRKDKQEVLKNHE